METLGSIPVISHSTKFWFPDGNVVLQAESTRYRIHQGILSMHSSVFQDMFAFPQPPNGEPLVEGCPIIHLSDTSTDWDAFLAVVYHLREYPQTHIPFPQTIPMLRLGHKYDFKLFRDEALSQLKCALPKQLYQWDQIFPGKSSERWLDYTTGHEFDVINIALELGLQSILPMAFFNCLTYRALAQIMRGSHRPDGSTVNLSYASQQMLVIAWEKLHRTTIEDVYGWVKDHDIFADCETYDNCSGARNKFFQEICADSLSMAFHPMEQTDCYADLCDNCREFAVSLANAGRCGLWGRLPSYFELPGWDDLKDF